MVKQLSPMTNVSYCILLAFTGVFGSLATGCGDSGPATYSVSGTVTYKGQPVPTGSVMFVPDSGKPVTAGISDDGSYAINAIEGSHRVSVVAMSAPPEGTDPWQPGATDSVKQLVPAKYGRPDTSGIVVQVSPQDTNDIDIQLE